MNHLLSVLPEVVLPLQLLQLFQPEHDAFNKAAPRTKAMVALLELLDGNPAVKHLASVLILPDFLLREFQLGITFLDGLRRFLLRHGWSLLSARRHKRAATSVWK